ncbi:MAG: C4-dicarboxylate ABC transporter permease [Deltaproteobacteria bacterium]|nr:MAG: C4-dicarboxylate ABC transporter permease [Deltaproteobacteria bacterium]
MTAEIILVSLLVLFALNTPIAVAIGAASLAGILVQGNVPLMMIAQRMFAGTDNFHLMAVPLFMFAGVLMEAGGISRRIIDFANALVGWLPGGLAAVTVISAMLFAGISGSAAADAAAMGAILIPAMKKSGYASDFSGAVLASSGSIGVIIPPSIPMIIFGFLTGASIGQLFTAGIIPGLLIGASLILVSTLLSIRHGYGATTLFSLAEIGRTFFRALLSLGAPLIILGGILTGVFTATESAAVAVVYALVVGMGIYRQIRPAQLPKLFLQGALTSSMVMFIIAMASIFSWIAAMEDLPAKMAGGLLSLTDNPVLLLILINLILLIAGVFIETTASLILLVPIITSMAPALHIDLIHLGVIVVTNLAIGMLTPPMGICLIVSGSISGDSLMQLSRRILPFLAILIADLLLITFYSPLAMTLPNLIAP